MVDGDRKQFSALIGTLCLAFSREASRELIEVYWLALNDLPLESVAMAVLEANRSETGFMPPPGKIRELATPKPSADLAAIEAWVLVRKHAVQHKVRKGPMDFGPVVNATVRAVGGIDFLSTEPADSLENFTRKRFIDAFRLYASQPADEHQSCPLVGEAAHGKPVQLIGVESRERPRIEHKAIELVAELADGFRL